MRLQIMSLSGSYAAAVAAALAVVAAAVVMIIVQIKGKSHKIFYFTRAVTPATR